MWLERESRVERVETRLDELMPVWQFGEYHTIEVAAPPGKTFEAMKAVTAGEIFLFTTLTWIRRGGRRVPESILNPGTTEPLIDVALRSGFVRLAEEPPREMVIGTVIAKPPGGMARLTPALFAETLAPGHTLAAMNFLVSPIPSGGSRVSTETRVFANSPRGRRAFGRYWLMIYPGSAFIRLMWLRAIKRKAVGDRLLL